MPCFYDSCNKKGGLAERKIQSKVRLHFMKEDDNSAGCIACKMIISNKPGTHRNIFLCSRNDLCLTLQVGGLLRSFTES